MQTVSGVIQDFQPTQAQLSGDLGSGPERIRSPGWTALLKGGRGPAHHGNRKDTEVAPHESSNTSNRPARQNNEADQGAFLGDEVVRDMMPGLSVAPEKTRTRQHFLNRLPFSVCPPKSQGQNPGCDSAGSREGLPALPNLGGCVFHCPIKEYYSNTDRLGEELLSAAAPRRGGRAASSGRVDGGSPLPPESLVCAEGSGFAARPNLVRAASFSS
ncbi:PREDICTED: uncharacterized protein LOC108539279 [Rhinopithecus bieti]|uniref:uncharacterized protein LOC108539279 n=1 Tax=Rhinopithecus bieti TaxID=61621 RepID=UPI00083C6744|nr:PREDICTED: uncharacterized protein LOC108539279 [Rhinopithecus bieti]